MLPTNLGACKPTFYTFHTSDLRWNRTMSRSFYHTDLGQNAVVLNFAIQIALIYIQDDRSRRGRLAKPLKKISKITYTASRFSLFTSAKLQWELSAWMKINRVTLLHSKEFFISILYLMVLERCVIFKSVWYARHFEYSCKWCSWTTENKRHSD